MSGRSQLLVLSQSVLLMFHTHRRFHLRLQISDFFSFQTLNRSHQPALTWEGVTRLGHGDKLELEVCVEVLVGPLVVGGRELMLGRRWPSPMHHNWGEGCVGVGRRQPQGGRYSLSRGRWDDGRRDVLHGGELPFKLCCRLGKFELDRADSLLLSLDRCWSSRCCDFLFLIFL